MKYHVRVTESGFSIDCDEETLCWIRDALAVRKQDCLINGQNVEAKQITDLSLSIVTALYAAEYDTEIKQ